MNICYLESDPRHPDVNYMALLMKSLRERGHTINKLNIYETITRRPYQYGQLQHPLSIADMHEIKFNDVFIYSNYPFNLDLSECLIPTLLIHDEDWKSVRIPHGTQFLHTSAPGRAVLAWASTYDYWRLKGVNTTLKGGTNLSLWEEEEKKVDWAYMGVLEPARIDNLMTYRYIWGIKRGFIKYAVEELGMTGWKPSLDYVQYRSTFPTVNKTLHFSGPHYLGQGGMEALACGSILIEYPSGAGAEASGLIHGENCFLFDTREELKYIIQREIPALSHEELEDIRAAGKKLCHDNFGHEHMYKQIEPFLNWIKANTIAKFGAMANSSKNISNIPGLKNSGVEYNPWHLGGKKVN